MRKNLLIISGSKEAAAGIKVAKRMGIYVVVSDIDPNAPGFAYADDYFIASTYDIVSTVRAAREYHNCVRKFDGVISVAADVPSTVAAVAAELGLPGISKECAELASDKLAMKEKFEQDGVSIPWYSRVNSIEHLKSLIHKVGYPLILKPVDSRGARGVLKLSPDINIEWAYEEAVRFSSKRSVMLERFLSGPQISTESVVIEGMVHTPGFSDRNYEFMETYTPYVIENGGDLPSSLPEKVKEATRNLVSEAARSLGVVNGTVKGDVVVHNGVPYIIELAPRLSGGYFCTHEIPLNTGVNFVGAAIRLALGEKLDASDLTPRYNRFVAQRYLFPKPGRVLQISGVDKASSMPGIELCELRVGVGDTVKTLDSHPARAGVVIATGENRYQAVSRAEAAVNMISVVTEP